MNEWEVKNLNSHHRASGAIYSDYTFTQLLVFRDLRTFLSGLARPLTSFLSVDTSLPELFALSTHQQLDCKTDIEQQPKLKMIGRLPAFYIPIKNA